MKNFLLKYKTLIGLFVSIVFLYLALNKINFNDAAKILNRSSVLTIIYILILAFLSRIIQAFRWYFLLHFTNKRTLRDAFNYINIGYLINNILPARIGDFVKSYLWAKKAGASKTDALASVFVERLFDMTGMGMIFILALLILKLPAYALNGGVILITLCSLSFFSILFLATNYSKLSIHLQKYNSNKIFNWVIRKLNKISKYSTFVINIRLTSILFVLTILIWFTYLFSGYLIIQELHPSPFSWHTAVLSLFFISIAFVIPSTPGNLGVYQYACILALEITGVGYSREEALVFSLISQLPVYFLSIILGLYSSYNEGFKLSKLKKYKQNLEIVEN